MSEELSGLLQRILEWADGRPDIVAVVMTGSRARSDGAVDAYSDHDLELFVADPSTFDNNEWFEEIGTVWVCEPLTSEEGYPVRLVFYEGGEKVDFQIRPAREFQALAVAGRVDEDVYAGADVWSRGYRVLRDRDGIASSLQAPHEPARSRPRPTEAEYLAANREFWFEAAHIPRYLMREELWIVQSRGWTMKEMFLQMLEWHVVATTGEGTDVWYDGTKMKGWVNADQWAKLQSVFGRFDRADSWRALLATMDLFRETSQMVARLYDFPYPLEQDEHISAYVLGFTSEF